MTETSVSRADEERLVIDSFWAWLPDQTFPARHLIKHSTFKTLASNHEDPLQSNYIFGHVHVFFCKQKIDM